LTTVDGGLVVPHRKDTVSALEDRDNTPGQPGLLQVQFAGKSVDDTDGLTGFVVSTSNWHAVDPPAGQQPVRDAARCRR